MSKTIRKKVMELGIDEWTVKLRESECRKESTWHRP